jgi:hypothetical protein
VVLKSFAERRVVTAGEKKLIMDPLSPLKDSGTAVSKYMKILKIFVRAADLDPNLFTGSGSEIFTALLNPTPTSYTCFCMIFFS